MCCCSVSAKDVAEPSSSAVVAEWLRRLTRNQFPSGSVGSNPTDCEIFSALVIYVVEVKSSISISWQGTTARLAMAINFVLMCFLGQNIFNLVGLRQEFNIASIVGSVVECSPATRAARVRFPDDANFCDWIVQKHNKNKRDWRRRVSIPVPLAC